MIPLHLYYAAMDTARTPRRDRPPTQAPREVPARMLAAAMLVTLIVLAVAACGAARVPGA